MSLFLKNTIFIIFGIIIFILLNRRDRFSVGIKDIGERCNHIGNDKYKCNESNSSGQPNIYGVTCNFPEGENKCICVNLGTEENPDGRCEWLDPSRSVLKLGPGGPEGPEPKLYLVALSDGSKGSIEWGKYQQFDIRQQEGRNLLQLYEIYTHDSIVEEIEEEIESWLNSSSGMDASGNPLFRLIIVDYDEVLFEKYDKDGDGYLNESEMTKFFAEQNILLPEEYKRNNPRQQLKFSQLRLFFNVQSKEGFNLYEFKNLLKESRSETRRVAAAAMGPPHPDGVLVKTSMGEYLRLQSPCSTMMNA